MRSPKSVDELIESIQSGTVHRYVYFWGHHPAPDGSITKSCFSQWWPAEFTHLGERYLTAEHYMMAAKARLFGDFEVLQSILTAEHPKQAKDLGRTVANFDDKTWKQHRFSLVVEGNLAKFKQHPPLSQFLLSTGNRIIVEASPVDRVWGIGLKADDLNASNPSRWQGLNLLGFALMEVRDLILSEIV